MSVPKITGVQLSEPSAGPLLLLGNSIGTSATALWAASAAFLGERFHVVAWDLPGHGRNTDPVSDSFSMAELIGAEPSKEYLGATELIIDRVLARAAQRHGAV